ncbi:hypothetical protein SLE2022_242260 [Rubroshorea leprosula]
MIWRNPERRAKELLRSTIVVEPFYVVTISLLSLLLPLSFLLLSRFSYVHYLFLVTATPFPLHPSFSLNFFLTIPAVLYVPVSTVSVAALVHGLTGKITFASESPVAAYRPRLFATWIILCALQVCVGLGIEGSIEAGVNGSAAAANLIGVKRSLFSRVIFFLGLHESMLLWFRTIVKPIVDDTIFGVVREESWVQRATVAVSLGSLWWWKLRDEVEGLVVGAESKVEMAIGMEAVDLVGWWLYYVTVTIGMVRLVKVVMWLGMIFLFEGVRIRNSDQTSNGEGKV